MLALDGQHSLFLWTVNIIYKLCSWLWNCKNVECLGMFAVSLLPSIRFVSPYLIFLFATIFSPCTWILIFVTIRLCDLQVRKWLGLCRNSGTAHIDCRQLLPLGHLVWVFSGLLRLFLAYSLTLISLSEYNLVMRKQWDGLIVKMFRLDSLFHWVCKSLSGFCLGRKTIHLSRKTI